MPLRACVVEGSTGEVDSVRSALMSADLHRALFDHPDLQPSRFPILTRVSDLHIDTAFVTSELEPLIAEVEEVETFFDRATAVKRFLRRLKTMCHLALSRQKELHFYAD